MTSEFNVEFQKMVNEFKSAEKAIRAAQDEFAREVSGNNFKRISISRSLPRTPSRESKFKRPLISRSLARTRSRKLIKPVNGRITSNFGLRFGGRRHMGIDIAARSGKHIISAADGTVRFSGWRSGYGRTVIIQHAQGLKTLYAHNSRNLVSKGDKVRQGQVIALVGSTGRSTGPHLHFEVRSGSVPQNPLNYFS
jgi:murein DD-endopeptidase MepM/ murein hydrolase activator NlpD